ncbi:MAG: CDP-alcohol phosphatidyltransferase family protein [bacterium]|nr:CDP-alcohol phosphatidyltransferase family protein [bacterium]
MKALKEWVRKVLLPVTRVFSKLHPNWLTVIGLLVTIFASLFYGHGIFWAGGLLLLVGGLFDVIDGEVAKLTGKASKFGAFLDSCIDRYSDFIVLFGIFCWYITTDSHRWTLNFASILVLLTILGSYMVSYTRARAEGIGIECKVGFGERAFRVPIIIIGSFLGPKIFLSFLLFLTCLTNLTAWYRMYWVYKHRE